MVAAYVQTAEKEISLCYFKMEHMEPFRQESNEKTQKNFEKNSRETHGYMRKA